METSLLILTSWWGLSDKPGHRKMELSIDGSYLIKEEYYLSKDFSDNKRKKGKFSEERLKHLNSSLKKLIKKNEERRLFDMGVTIDFFNGTKRIKIVNNMDLWKQVMEIIPEFNKAF